LPSFLEQRESLRGRDAKIHLPLKNEMRKKMELE